MRGSLAERFWEKVDKNGPVPEHRPQLGQCAVWTASLSDNGYGQLWFPLKRRPERAHRVGFFLVHGRLPTPDTLHLCDYRPCVKAWADERGPAHVIEGSRQSNVSDMMAKGRHWAQQHPGEALLRGEAHGRAKLTQAQVDDLRIRYAAGAASLSDLAAEFDVTKQAIHRIVTGKTWIA